MDRDGIESIMKECLSLQGSYGRLYNAYIHASEEEQDSFCDAAIDAGVNDILSFIMFVEGGA